MEIQFDLEKQCWAQYRAYVEKKLQSQSKSGASGGMGHHCDLGSDYRVRVGLELH